MTFLLYELSLWERSIKQKFQTKVWNFQICPEMHANEMQALYNKHHKVSSHIKVQNTHDSVRHEVILK